jgi:hypothetical protein
MTRQSYGRGDDFPRPQPSVWTRTMHHNERPFAPPHHEKIERCPSRQ